MIDLVELLWGFSLLSLFLHFLHVIKEVVAVTTTLPSGGTATSSSSCSSSSGPFSSSSILCFGHLQKKLLGIWSRYNQLYPLPDQTTLLIETKPCTDQYSPVSTFGGQLVVASGGNSGTGKKETGDQIISSNCLEISNPEESSFLGLRGLGGEGVKPSARQESGVSVDEEYYSSSSGEAADGRKKEEEEEEEEEEVRKQQVLRGRMRKRPSRIIIPESNRGFEASDVEAAGNDSCEKDFQVQGREYCLASRRGRKKVMEDGYGVITNISGDSKQAFFGVYDGHGGRAAVDHVVDKLGTNILRALEEQPNGKKEQLTRTSLLMAAREGYLTTDQEFLAQGVGSGACAATVLIKDGEVVVANVGDCRVVLSRKGSAHALTSDHRPDREDERVRIENSGGYVNNQNGVWRVHGSLAISRAIGDSHMKDWIISEPEMATIGLDSDCEFLIVASDGLWDKVGNQEAVDVVLKHKYSVESCKKLVDMACSRGNKDDITVMVVALQNFST